MGDNGTRSQRHGLKPSPTLFDYELDGMIQKPSHNRKAGFPFLVGSLAVLTLAFLSICVLAISGYRATGPSADATVPGSRQPELCALPSATGTVSGPGAEQSARHLVHEKRPTPAVATVRSAQRRYLGIYEEPVVTRDGRPGMMVTYVQGGTPAEGIGLRFGDVIRSANGYETQQPGNLAWIIANATPGDTLLVGFTSAHDGADYVATASLPGYKANTFTPGYTSGNRCATLVSSPDATVNNWSAQRDLALASGDYYLAAVYERHIFMYNQGWTAQATVSLQCSLRQLVAYRLSACY